MEEETQTRGMPATVETQPLAKSSLRTMQVPVSVQYKESPQGPINMAVGKESTAELAGPSGVHPVTAGMPDMVETVPSAAEYLRMTWLPLSAM